MKIINIIAATITTSLLLGCATGKTPEDKKKNAEKETAKALKKIYKDHPSSKSVINQSLAYLVCTGSDGYLFAASLSGGVCTLKEKGKSEFYRFASVGVGMGIGFKQVAFVYAYSSAQALKRFKEEGWDAGARAEVSAIDEDEGGQAVANTSYDVDGVRIYQSALWGAAAQATVQGYKFWPTDFAHDVIQNRE